MSLVPETTPALTEETRRFQRADDLLRRFGAAVRSVQLYSSSHPLVARNLEALHATLMVMHVYESSVAIGFLESEIVVGSLPLPRTAESMGDLVRRLEKAGIERIIFDRGVEVPELVSFVQKIARADRLRLDGSPNGDVINSAHVRVGRIEVGERAEGAVADSLTIRRLYTEAVSMAGLVWDSARLEQGPDPGAARTMVDGLAQAVSQNRTALIALTALRDYDNYTFTHMVNVSILTMALARSLGVEGPLLREFGLAALMHDIGKVHTPPEILHKPDKLSDAEFAVMKRHPLDGAEILRRTHDIPALAPVVAFEHHLRLDGSGYPEGVQRASLNLGTMLCSIADVYDAMRSQRKYQQAFPTERILAVLHGNGHQFDQHLVRRFVQLVGIYPPGNLVRLNTNEVAVVLRIHAPDPYRPRIRLLFKADGTRLALPQDINLWETAAHPTLPQSIISPVNAADYDVDPISLMQ